MTLVELNALDREAFVRAVGFAFEHSPWVMERAFYRAPFADVGALCAAARAVLEGAGEPERLALIRAHPELAGKAAIAGDLTVASTSEQAAAGLSALTPEEMARFQALNGAYGARFGFPFIVCARLSDKSAILEAMARRLGHTAEAEVAEAIGQIALIGALRLADVVEA